MLCQETSEPMSDSVRVSVANQTIVPPHHLCMLQVTCSVSVQELGSSAYFIEGVQKFKDKHPDLDVGEVISLAICSFSGFVALYLNCKHKIRINMFV